MVLAIIPEWKKKACRFSSLYGRLVGKTRPICHIPAHAIFSLSLTVSTSMQRPIVFMDIQIGETPAGRMKFELFSDIVPKYICNSLPHSASVIDSLSQNRRELSPTLYRRI